MPGSFQRDRLGVRRLESVEARRVINLGFFTYFLIAAVLWLVDALSRGWTVFSVLTLALLVLFVWGFGYFTLVNGKAAWPVMRKEGN